MVLKRNEFPIPGEFVIGSVTRIENHGAYVKLEEYKNKEGLIHISEISSGWIRNIRNVVKEKQQLVLRVINVDSKKGHINLSLRRVNLDQKKEKLKAWKRAQKADGLLKLLVNEVNQGKTLIDAYKEVGWILEDQYNDIYSAFEVIKNDKTVNLSSFGISDLWIKPLLEIIDQHIEIPYVSISGELILTSYAPNGVEIIRNALKEAESFVEKDKNIDIKIFCIGAPRFKLNLSAPNYKIAESTLNSITNKIITAVQSQNGNAQFKRT